MEPLFQQADMDLQQIHVQMRQLEQCQSEGEAQPHFELLQQKIGIIGQNLVELDRMVNKESSTKRRTSKYRYDQLKYDYAALETATNALQNRLRAKWRASEDRNELLTKRFKPNETHLDFESTELAVNDRLKSSNSAVDDLISQGNLMLTSLREQHLGLKGMKRKMLDIGQMLGLSSTTLRMIEKRLDEDWLLFLILCVAFLVFMYCFYSYWKS